MPKGIYKRTKALDMAGAKPRRKRGRPPKVKTFPMGLAHTKAPPLPGLVEPVVTPGPTIVITSITTLYTRWAIHHLRDMAEARQKLADYSNLNLINVTSALTEQMQALITVDPHYRDAAAWLFLGVEPPPYQDETPWARKPR